MSVTNSIPTTLNDLLVKLKFMSMIERGKKINMGTMTFSESTSWIAAFYRGLSGEGRKGLMIHINQIIQQAISAINEYQDTEFCTLVVNHLAEAKIGIQNLTTTYQRDHVVVAQIDVCVSNIDLQLEKNRSLLLGHQHKVSSVTPTIPITIPVPNNQPINQPITNNQTSLMNQLIPTTQPAFGAGGIVKSPAALPSMHPTPLSVMKNDKDNHH